MAEPSCLRGLAMAEPHSRAPQLGGSGLGHASSFRLFVCVSFGIRGFSRSTEVGSTRFLNLAELSSIRTQRYLFRRILRSFDPLNMPKHRRVQSKEVVGGPCRGSPAPGGLGHGMAEPFCLRGSAMASPIAELPSWGGSELGHASSIERSSRFYL